MNKLLSGVEECCRAFHPDRRPFEWRENGRFFRLESKENIAGRFLLCSVIDEGKKKHSLVFPEGRGFLNGWTMLAEKIRGLGYDTLQESKPTRIMKAEMPKGEEKKWTRQSKSVGTWGRQHVLKEEEVIGSSMESAVWLDVGDCGGGKELGSLQFCLIGKWKIKPDPHPTAKVMEVWFKDAWRLNEEVELTVLNEDLLMLEFDLPEKAKWVLESGRRNFKGGVLQLDWWRPEAGCLRRKDSIKEVWIRVVGLPLHLWKPEILRKLGEACGGFVAVDENTEKKMEARWARLLIKVEGKSRPSVVNILEGSRSFELQIWWEIPPWVTEVYPVSSRIEARNPEVEDDGEARAVKRLSFPGPKSNLIGQREQARREKVGKKLASVASEALMDDRGGVHSGARWNQERFRVMGEESFQQAVYGGGPKAWASCDKRLVAFKSGSGPKEGTNWQQCGARKTPTDGAARRGGLCGPEVVEVQAGPSNKLRDLKDAKREVGGSKKEFKGIRPSGEVSGSEEKRRMKGGDASPGAKVSSDLHGDPAWICARGTLLYALEGPSVPGDTSRFECCWEQGLLMVSAECPVSGCSGQGKDAVGNSEGSFHVLQELEPKSYEADDHIEFRSHAKGPRLENTPSTASSSSIISVFGRPLLSGGPSDLGDFLVNETVGDLVPLRVVSVDGREWGKGTVSVPTVGDQETGKEESEKKRPECMGYKNWEDSCLFKFSEFLGVTTVGFEEEILNLMRKLEAQQEGDKRKGYPTETRCERELRKLECTINYSGKSQNRGGRDRGDFLLKLK